MAAPRMVGRPKRRCIHSKKVIAVYANARDAEAEAACGEWSALAACRTLEAGDRPLVVNHVEDDRSLVDRGERQGVVEIRLGGAAIAQPGCGNVVFALDG